MQDESLKALVDDLRERVSYLRDHGIFRAAEHGQHISYGDLATGLDRIAAERTTLLAQLEEREKLLREARPFVNLVGFGLDFTKKGRAEALVLRDRIDAALSIRENPHG